MNGKQGTEKRAAEKPFLPYKMSVKIDPTLEIQRSKGSHFNQRGAPHYTDEVQVVG